MSRNRPQLSSRTACRLADVVGQSVQRPQHLHVFPSEPISSLENASSFSARIGMRPVWKEKWESEAGLATEHTEDTEEIETADHTEEIAATEHTENTESPAESPPASCAARSHGELSTINSPLTRRLDGCGREIFVESEDNTGKPTIWYRIDRDGVKFRHERKVFGINVEKVA